MVLRCGKTGRLFFSQEEATEHAEAFGAAYANFEEVSLDSKVWICVESGRHAETEAKMNDIKRRDPDSKTWEEKDVRFLIEKQKAKDEAAKKKNRFYDSVDQKKLAALTEVKGHNRNVSAKALHYTKDKNTLEAAEAWIAEHKDDKDIEKIDDEFVVGALGDAADVDMPDANAPEEPDARQVGDPNPEEVKEFVNKDILPQLIEMGFSEVRAEKALYLRDNNLEHAVAWLGEHADDADIDLPLKPKPKVPEKPKMSKEEAEAKAQEMQAKLRAKKAEEEKLSEKEKERMRVESTKMMAETAERMKEEERKRAFEQQRIEKEAHEKHKAALKEQLRLDYIERFGCEPPPEEEEQEKKLKDKPLREQLLHWLGKLKKHKDTNAAGLKTCMQTLKIYGTNLKDNPSEPKFKVLKLDNKAFVARIAPFPEAIEVLKVIGFEDKGDGQLAQKTQVPDGFLIGELIKFSDIMMGQI